MRAFERQTAYIQGQQEVDAIHEQAYQLFMSEYKPGMSAWVNQSIRVRESYYDRARAQRTSENPYRLAGILADDGDFDD